MDDTVLYTASFHICFTSEYHAHGRLRYRLNVTNMLPTLGLLDALLFLLVPSRARDHSFPLQPHAQSSTRPSHIRTSYVCHAGHAGQPPCATQQYYHTHLDLRSHTTMDNQNIYRRLRMTIPIYRTRKLAISPTHSCIHPPYSPSLSPFPSQEIHPRPVCSAR